MNTSTEDRRVRKTKKALREGLAELMLEKDLRSITVRELSDKVDIHRATFYTHYKDIYDLYEQIENTSIEELSSTISDVTLDYEVLFEALIDYIYENAAICRMFLKKNSNSSFLDRISVMLEIQYLEVWINEIGQNKVTDEWKYYASYHVQGILAIIRRWAESGFEYSKNKIVKIIVKIDSGFDELLTE